MNREMDGLAGWLALPVVPTTSSISAHPSKTTSLSSWESIMHQYSHFHRATPLALFLIADTVLNPAFLAEELEAQCDAAFYKLRELNAKPDMILREILHNILYGEKGLGNPLICQEDRITTINNPMLRSYMKERYRRELVYKCFPSLNYHMQNPSNRISRSLGPNSSLTFFPLRPPQSARLNLRSILSLPQFTFGNNALATTGIDFNCLGGRSPAYT
jgi:hypothetical protein